MIFIGTVGQNGTEDSDILIGSKMVLDYWKIAFCPTDNPRPNNVPIIFGSI